MVDGIGDGQDSPQSPQVAPASSASLTKSNGTQTVFAAVVVKASLTHIKIPSSPFTSDVHAIMSDPAGHPSGHGPHCPLRDSASSTRSVGTHNSTRVIGSVGSTLCRGMQHTAPKATSVVLHVDISLQALQTGTSSSCSNRLLPRRKNFPPSIVSFLQMTGAGLGIRVGSSLGIADGIELGTLEGQRSVHSHLSWLYINAAS